MKKLIVLLIALTMVFGGYASAAPSDTALLRVGAVGVMVGNDNGDMELSKEIKRSEFAVIICRLAGCGELEPADSRFDDAKAAYWGSGYIENAAAMGIISGVDKKHFEPERSVTYTECAKMLLCLLGYGGEAEKLGGYPGGYIAKAAELGLYDGVLQEGENAIRGEIVKMIDNAFDVKPLKPMYGKDGGYELSNETLYEKLTKSSELTKIRGVLEGNEISDADLDGEIKIDGIVYQSPKAYSEYLGMTVLAYAGENDGKTEITNLISAESSNKVYEFDAENVEVTEGYIENTNEDGTRKKLNINSATKFFINGREVLNPSLNDKRADYGSYSVVDNNSDKTADYVFIKSPESVIADRVNAEKKAVYFKNGYTAAGKTGFVFKENDDDCRYTFLNADGSSSSFDEIKPSDVLSFLASRDKKLVTVIVSHEKISGKISGKRGEYVEIDGKEYKIARGGTVTYNIGDSAEYAIDAFGRIAGITGAKNAGLKYAYITDAGIKSGIGGKTEIQVIHGGTPEKSVKTSGGTETISYYLQNEEKNVLSLADRVIFGIDCFVGDGESVSSSEISPSVLKECAAGYALNKDGEVSELYIYNVPDLMKSYTFNAKLFAFGGENVDRGFFSDESTSVICIPNTVKSSDDYDVRVSVTDKNTYTVYGVLGLPVNEAGAQRNAEPQNVIILRTSMDSSQPANITKDRDICMVGTVSKTASEDGGEIYKIEMLNSDEKLSLETKADSAANSAASKLRKGDLVQFVKDSSGKIENIKKLASVQGLKDFSDTGNLYGEVWSIDYNMYDYFSNSMVDLITVAFGNGAENKQVRLFLEDGQPVYRYDRRSGYIYAGDTGDITSVTASAADASKIFVLMEDNDALAFVIIDD